MDFDEIVALIPSSGELSWLGDVWAALSTPSSIVLLFLTTVVFKPKATENLLRLVNPFRSVKIFGAEFILEKGAARQGREEFAQYRQQVIHEFELLSDQYRVQQQFEVVALRVLAPAFETCFGIPIGEYRAAVHIEDVLIRESLFQLVDDFPRRGGRGQLKSIRFGLIGRVWRRHQSEITGPVRKEFDERINEWGMNQAEALTVARGKQFFSATLLQDRDNVPIGIFYVDTETLVEPLPEESKKAFHNELAKGCADYGLIASLTSITQDLRGRSPLISIYD